MKRPIAPSMPAMAPVKSAQPKDSVDRKLRRETSPRRGARTSSGGRVWPSGSAFSCFSSATSATVGGSKTAHQDGGASLDLQAFTPRLALLPVWTGWMREMGARGHAHLRVGILVGQLPELLLARRRAQLVQRLERLATALGHPLGRPLALVLGPLGLVGRREQHLAQDVRARVVLQGGERQGRA